MSREILEAMHALAREKGIEVLLGQLNNPQTTAAPLPTTNPSPIRTD